MKSSAIQRILGAILGLTCLYACSPDAEQNKLYVISKSAQKLHVFNAKTLFSVLAQPLSFAGVGNPNTLVINPQFHQLMITVQNSNRLVRIGTEAPYSYQPLAFTQYGSASDIAVSAVANPPQKHAFVLTRTGLFRINEYGQVTSGFTESTPTPTATPSASATPTATPTATPGTFSTGAVTLPSTCLPSSMALNMSVRLLGISDDEGSSSDSGSSDTSSSSSSSDENSVRLGGDTFKDAQQTVIEGGTVVAITCAGNDTVLVYDTKTLALVSTISLASGSAPTDILYVRKPKETGGSTINGAFAIWNTNHTIDILTGSGTSYSKVSGSPFTVGGAITAYGLNPDYSDGVFMTGYTSGGAAYVDVRTRTGSPISGSPFQLSSDCATSGPGGLYADRIKLELSQEQSDAGASSEDLVIYYSCPDTGLVGGLTANGGFTYLTRNLGAGTRPMKMIQNPLVDVLYVALTGSTSPAPGVIALSRITLGNAFEPAAVTFPGGALPDILSVQP